ncbi:hypothetical protein BC826DRAFT_911990 [Russula brevipes]|nr:hypothetical protein BC826DRAFT_911990 [Russula brevipes]
MFTFAALDIERLSLRPLKWLRFVAFAVLGVKGHLYDSPGGNVVDYGVLSPANLAKDYYYFSPEVDDRITSSALTERGPRFRSAVALRDGNCCVITTRDVSYCDAAHIIPHSKGDEYIQRVITDRRVLYEDVDPEISSMDINSTQNGILLSKELHAWFRKGHTQFVKTPNFALDLADIPRVETGGMPASRVTMQHIVPVGGRVPVPEWDVAADWSGPLAPPSILLDFMYGIAVMKRWAADDLQGMLYDYHRERFTDIPLIIRSDPAEEGEGKGDIEPDDPSDGNYVPPGCWSSPSDPVRGIRIFSGYGRCLLSCNDFQTCPPQAHRRQGRYKRSVHVKRGARRSKGGWKRVSRHYSFIGSDSGGLTIGHCRYTDIGYSQE